jgi:two-component system, cell cycle response regulator
VVAGTALSTEGRAPLAIALLASATVALVGIVDALGSPLDARSLAWMGFNAVALVLLADIATAASRAQRHARDEALRASRFDGLTGLYNRAFFFTTMEQEIRRSDRMGRGFTMLMLDLDDLKPVNDTFGHQWGDRMLRAVADTIRQTIRFTDAAARYGGDEFVLLLPETDAAGGYVVAEKLRRDIAAVTLRAADRNVRSTVSVGLVTYPDDGRTIEQLVAAADVAMYESKRRGKNRIVGYQTRTERVATAIDIEVESGAVAELPAAPAVDVRTGGDPAPWGAIPTPIEPATRMTEGIRAPSPEPRSAPGPEPPAPPPIEAPARAVGARPSGQPWLTRTDDAGAGPPRQPPSEPGPPGGSRPPGASRAPETHPPDAPEQRPAADLSPGAGAGGRSPSRSEEIRSSGERPWIALPIEPWEPPERPKG